MASLEHDVPIMPTSAFYAASVSKQFIAFAVAMPAPQGELSLDDDRASTW
jgi:CubicO group peptidase (beta-lactamase class C family)